MPGINVPYYDNKYVQYRLMSDSFNATIGNWQGVDDEPIAGSNNLVKSDGVAESVRNTQKYKNTEEEGLFITDKQGNVLAEFLNSGFDTNPSENFIKKVLSKINKDVLERGVFFCNEKGEVFAEYKNGKFNAIGIQANIESLEDIGNVGEASVGQVLIKQANGTWQGGNAGSITVNNTINQAAPQSIEQLTDVEGTPSEGNVMQYQSGAWKPAQIQLDSSITPDSRANHPLYGKHFFVFGDSHTEAPGFGLWQRFCELTGAIYHTLLRKTDGYFYTTTEFNQNNQPINEVSTGVKYNCDGFNWANYAYAAYTYAQANNVPVDYILVHNCHMNPWTIDASTLPWQILLPTKLFTEQVFVDGDAIRRYFNANIHNIITNLGISSISEASINFFWGGKQQTLDFSFTSGDILSINTTVNISFGGTSQVISTSLTASMTISECIDAVNQWAFNEFSGWTNKDKGTTGLTNLLLTHRNEAGSYNDLNAATISITTGSNLSVTSSGITDNTSDISAATPQSYCFNSKNISEIEDYTKWTAVGGAIGWTLPNQMLGALQYMGSVSPATKFVFLALQDIYIDSTDVFLDGSVNPYTIMSRNDWVRGKESNNSLKLVANTFGWQYIDVWELAGITAFNAYPTYYELRNVHLKQAGYRRIAECVAKYIK